MHGSAHVELEDPEYTACAGFTDTGKGQEPFQTATEEYRHLG